MLHLIMMMSSFLKWYSGILCCFYIYIFFYIYFSFLDHHCIFKIMSIVSSPGLNNFVLTLQMNTYNITSINMYLSTNRKSIREKGFHGLTLSFKTMLSVWPSLKESLLDCYASWMTNAGKQLRFFFYDTVHNAYYYETSNSNIRKKNTIHVKYDLQILVS